ncbi:MAG TPA: ABC-2 family transporter protein [Ruminiclostridium sp.]|nr:ABC-2 family transporter protein [Ruminiclostridium sp.]
MKSSNKYIFSFQIGMQNAMEYRANFFLSIVAAIVPIFIQTFLWISVYKNSDNSVVFGYSFAQIIQYTVIAQLVSRFVRTDFEAEINEDIKNGGLNKFIVRPIGYFTHKLCCFMGQKVVNLVVMMILFITSILLLKFSLGVAITGQAIAAFVVSLLLSLCLNFLIFFCISTMCFWLNEIGFIFEAVRIIIITLSGGIFPLSIFGSKVVSVLEWMPFKYTINFPVDVLNSQITGWATVGGIFIQIGWILLILLLANLFWYIGSKKYIAVGG